MDILTIKYTIAMRLLCRFYFALLVSVMECLPVLPGGHFGRGKFHEIL